MVAIPLPGEILQQYNDMPQPEYTGRFRKYRVCCPLGLNVRGWTLTMK
jgi:hypothetical protein